MKRALIVMLALVVVALAALKVYLVYRPLHISPNVDPGWNAGPVVHLLPTANDHRFLLKVSFKLALTAPPFLSVDGKIFKGVRTDTRGFFWSFDADGLQPATRYRLVLQDVSGKPLCDPWHLSTFPAPDDHPGHLRLLIFTGAGGHDAHIQWYGTGPLPLEVRKKLLNKALAFKPDAVISSGDQIYYDLRYDKSAQVMGASARSIHLVGKFDPSLDVLGTQNEAVLKKAVDAQVAYLYGTRFRSTPTFFLLDDHDYFENDIATEKKRGFSLKLLLIGLQSPFYRGGVSFPPDRFSLQLGRATQKLYLPEFLPDENRPADLPSSGAADRAPGVSECYGTLRYGKLFEGLLYEGRRFVTLDGPKAVLTHAAAEKWLIERMQAEQTEFVINLPALAFGWSAGKWMEYYPDVRGADGKLTVSESKYLWPEGWFAQHNRLLKAAAGMKHTLPLFICGDLHSQAHERIVRSGDLDLGANPPVIVLSGSLGTGRRMWPSSFRGLVSEPPVELTAEQGLAPVEKNGFIIADFTAQKAVIKFYAWRPPQPLEAIDSLTPYHVLELQNPTMAKN